MGILTASLVETATIWTEGPLGDYGDSTFNAPTTISVRWEDKVERFFTSDGSESQSKSVVLTDQPLSPTAYIYLGTSVVANPRTLQGAYRIKGVDQTKSLDGTESIYKVYL